MSSFFFSHRRNQNVKGYSQNNLFESINCYIWSNVSGHLLNEVYLDRDVIYFVTTNYKNVGNGLSDHIYEFMRE